MEPIVINKLDKSFKKTKIISNLNLTIPKEKIIAFFGPNGCGKSTFMNILSKIIKKDSGTIENFNYEKDDIEYVFQNFHESLFPWRTNKENLAFPLQINKSTNINQHISNIYNKYNFDIDLNLYPYELSGGQKQFLAFLRAIITNPKLLLLDEPFSALDYENSFLLSDKLQEYYLSNKPTILIVTHNIEEAVYLADQIVVLSKKPTKVLAKIKNPLPYPRTLDTLRSEEFHNIKNDVLRIFQSEVKL
ncbi:nitrate ABC transporter ATP-binding protein [Candidatus Pacearchaeota archaeon]|nr:nitrate ABC transporter ATP-binding protein [Candidatus Pacearchaeota archaeon]|tara:strand:- start:1481 stop:2221 length:741 start_codon:yes stop_codon:yes gene_type:complete